MRAPAENPDATLDTARILAPIPFPFLQIPHHITLVIVVHWPNFCSPLSGAKVSNILKIFCIKFHGSVIYQMRSQNHIDRFAWKSWKGAPWSVGEAIKFWVECWSCYWRYFKNNVKNWFGGQTSQTTKNNFFNAPSPGQKPPLPTRQNRTVSMTEPHRLRPAPLPSLTRRPQWCSQQGSLGSLPTFVEIPGKT